MNETEPSKPDSQPTLYTPPYGHEPYLPVPRSFWTEGLAGELSGAGIAMYLCALALTRSNEPEFFISTSFFEERYGISRSSKKRGLAELTERGVLTVKVEETLDINTFRKVRRNVYRITKIYRQPAAWVPPSDEKGAAAVAALDKLLGVTKRTSRRASAQ